MMSNNNEPNTPSNPQGQETESVVDRVNQVDLARQLNNLLTEINNRMELVTQATQTQAGHLNAMVVSVDEISQASSNFVAMSQQISTNIEASANAVMERLNANYFNRVNDSLNQVAESARSGITSQSQAYSDLTGNVDNFNNAGSNLTEQMSESADHLQTGLSRTGEEARQVSETAEEVNRRLETTTESARKANEKVNDLNSGYGSVIKKITSFSFGFFGAVVNSMSSLVGAAANFTKFALTLPFTIMKEAANIGNAIRTDLVEVIGNASEALKEKFDLTSDIGEGIVAMTNRGKGMLMAFQSPSNELVKLFGYGADGIANMIGFMGENIEAMGHFSELFGKSLMKDQNKLKNFTRMVKGMGLSSEDVAYLAMDAANNMKHVEVRMAELGVTLGSVSKEFQVDRKRLSKNFMILRKDITQFGHLSDEEIARTTASLTQMKVKLEDAASVFKKFSTFEDAANSVAMLSQTFGMNLDAMDIIQAQNPEDIINMFRDSMMQTGRSFQDLNRFEKDLMAQHTGMSSESLSAMMNYRDMGLTYEEARKKMESEKPTAKQMKALKELNTAIKEVQKVMNFTSPFKAFADGLASNLTLTGDLKKTLLSLSSGYEGIYEYARGLDKDTFSDLIKPIQMIINIMTSIFESDAFKDGLTNTLTAISNFVGDMFGVTSSNLIVSRLSSNIRSVTEGSGYTKKTKQQFREATYKELDKVIREKGVALSQEQAIDFSKFKDKSDVTGLLKELDRVANDPTNPKAQKAANNVLQEVVKVLTGKKVSTSGGNETKPFKTASQNFQEAIEKTFMDNADNAKKTSKLSLSVMGAIIKGAASGFIALLRVVNDGIDMGDAILKASDNEKTNYIADYLQLDPKELRTMGDELGKAVRGLFDRKDSILNLSGWILEGFYDVFKVLLSFFGSALLGVLRSFMSGFRGSPDLAFKTAEFSPSVQKNSFSNITESLAEGEEYDNTAVGGLHYKMFEKINKLSDEKEKASALSLLESVKTNFKKSDGSFDDAQTAVADMTAIDRAMSVDKKTGKFKFDKKLGLDNVSSNIDFGDAITQFKISFSSLLRAMYNAKSADGNNFNFYEDRNITLTSKDLSKEDFNKNIDNLSFMNQFYNFGESANYKKLISKLKINSDTDRRLESHEVITLLKKELFNNHPYTDKFLKKLYKKGYRDEKGYYKYKNIYKTIPDRKTMDSAEDIQKQMVSGQISSLMPAVNKVSAVFDAVNKSKNTLSQTLPFDPNNAFVSILNDSTQRATANTVESVTPLLSTGDLNNRILMDKGQVTKEDIEKLKEAYKLLKETLQTEQQVDAVVSVDGRQNANKLFEVFGQYNFFDFMANPKNTQGGTQIIPTALKTSTGQSTPDYSQDQEKIGVGVGTVLMTK